MGRKWEQVTGKVKVRESQGRELVWDVVSTFTEHKNMQGTSVSESKLKDVRSPDRRIIYSREEGQWYFADEPDRIFQIAE
jgi:hypothetical protein